jgi:cold shock CspA family protein
MTEKERCRYQRRYGLKERQQGRVKTINAKGYLFITGNDGVDIFAHRSQVAKFEAVARSDLVSYVAGVSGKDPTGMPRMTCGGFWVHCLSTRCKDPTATTLVGFCVTTIRRADTEMSGAAD